MILLIKHTADWELIHHINQTQINKDKICNNSKRLDHDYQVGDKFMLTNNAAFEYETPYNRRFYIMQCWTNGTVTLQYGVETIRYDIRQIKLYTSDINVEDNICQE